MITTPVILFLIVALGIIYVLGMALIGTSNNARSEFRGDCIAALDAEHPDYIEHLQTILNNE